MDYKAIILVIAAIGMRAKTNNIQNAKPTVVDNLSDLQTAINNANEDVETTILVNSFSMSNSTIKDAMRNLNINGKNIVIKGASADTTITSFDQGSMYIIGQKDKTNSITFEGITFEQAIDSGKSIMTPNNAISISKNSYSTNLKVKDCTFKNFTGAASSGGAIQMAFSNAEDYKLNVEIDNCSFLNCYSKIGGGAISLDASDNAVVDIKNSTFSSCTSPLGGALSLRHAKTSISQCVFSKNGETKGGAIFTSECDSFVSNNTFVDNVSTSSDGSSVYVEDSKFHNNVFINNTFINKLSDYKEFYFDTSTGSLPEIKSKLFFNTFMCDKDIDISYSSHLEHYEEFGNLYISNHYSGDISRVDNSAYTSNKDVVRLVNEKHYLSNNEGLKLEKDDYLSKLSTFYINIYGDFYIGDNLSDTVDISYNGKVYSIGIDDELELNASKFGFDLVDNVVGDSSFTLEKSLLSSNAPIKVTPIYKLNTVGVATFVGVPSFVVVLGATVVLLVLLRKKRHKTTTTNQSFDIDEWAKQAVNDDAFISLTPKEKEILYYILKDTPRKEIAASLYISESTVKNHVTKIFSKLNIKNRSELLMMLDKK